MAFISNAIRFGNIFLSQEDVQSTCNQRSSGADESRLGESLGLEPPKGSAGIVDGCVMILGAGKDGGSEALRTFSGEGTNVRQDLVEDLVGKEPVFNSKETSIG
jgi:hypothetical protein